MTAMTTRDKPASPPPETATVIQLHGVSKTYYKPDGSIMVEALRDADLQIRRGEYVAVMGASGSGKSTLMNIIGCLDKPTTGRYLLDGSDVQAMSDERLSVYRGQKIGFVFQTFNLIPQLRIEENIEVPLFYQGTPRHERRARALAGLDQVGLGDRIGHRPSELSGGQQQRVAIARALINDPVVLLADEPTGNLDSTTGDSILALFEQLHDQGMTIAIVTHDESIAHRCSRVIRLKDGRIDSDTLADH
jgi:putative ABC transport system ATP-binding protein